MLSADRLTGGESEGGDVAHLKRKRKSSVKENGNVEFVDVSASSVGGTSDLTKCFTLDRIVAFTQTSVRSFNDRLIEERSDGVNLPELRHLSAWTTRNNITPS